jgi:hypothetical protein
MRYAPDPLGIETPDDDPDLEELAVNLLSDLTREAPDAHAAFAAWALALEADPPDSWQAVLTAVAARHGADPAPALRRPLIDRACDETVARAAARIRRASARQAAPA